MTHDRSYASPGAGAARATAGSDKAMLMRLNFILFGPARGCSKAERDVCAYCSDQDCS